MILTIHTFSMILFECGNFIFQHVNKIIYIISENFQIYTYVKFNKHHDTAAIIQEMNFYDGSFSCYRSFIQVNKV